MFIIYNKRSEKNWDIKKRNIKPKKNNKRQSNYGNH